jgi:hypothetical protein
VDFDFDTDFDMGCGLLAFIYLHPGTRAAGVGREILKEPSCQQTREMDSTR